MELCNQFAAFGIIIGQLAQSNLQAVMQEKSDRGTNTMNTST